MTGQQDMEMTGGHASPARPLPAASAAAIQALEQQAWKFFQKGDFEVATQLAARVVRLAPRRPWAHYLLGEIEVKREQWEMASGHFVRAVELGRVDAETLVRAGEACMKSGRNREAVGYLERALATGNLPEQRRRVLVRVIEQLS